jgi:WD40 repeat protein
MGSLPKSGHDRWGGRRRSADDSRLPRPEDAAADMSVAYSVAAVPDAFAVPRTDVFVSYSRRDGDVVRRLYTALKERGKQVWVDWEDIPPTADWRARIDAGIEAATAYLWSIPSGEKTAELDHGDTVWHVSFSPDGRLIATASGDGTARIWDAEDGAEVTALRHGRAVYTADFSPDGGFVATAGDGDRAFLWRTSDWRVAAVLRGRHARFSRDGGLVATVSKQAADLWRAPSGRRVAHLQGHAGGPISWAEASPDGTRAVTAGSDGKAVVWDVRSGEIVTELRGHAEWVPRASFSGDGDFVLTVSWDGTARVWDAWTGEVAADLRGHVGLVADGAFSPRGDLIGTAGDDGAVRLWRPIGAQPRLTLRPGARFAPRQSHEDPPGPPPAAVTADGRSVVTAEPDGSALVRNTSSGELVARLRGDRLRLSSLGTSRDGTHVLTASYDGSVRIWTSSGRLLRRLTHGSPILSAAISPDASRVLTVGAEGPARIWSATNGRLQATLRTPEGVVMEAAAFGPDGRRVLTLDPGSKAWLWDTASGRLELEVGSTIDPVIDAALAADGRRLVVLNKESGIVALDTATGRRLSAIRPALTGAYSVFLSPGGRVALTSTQDGVVHVWDVEAGSQRTVFRGHRDGVRAAAFSANGRFAVRVSADGSAHVWDTVTGRPRATLLGQGAEIPFVSFLGERSIAMTSSDGSVRIFDCALCAPLDELVRLARARTTRSLTPTERRTYLHSE